MRRQSWLTAPIGRPTAFFGCVAGADCGTWSGKTPAQVQQEFPDGGRSCRAIAHNHRQGGKNLDLMARFRQLLIDWPQPDCLGIVTHGVVSRAILGCLLDLTLSRSRRVKHPGACSMN